MKRTLLCIILGFFLTENAGAVSIDTSFMRNALDENNFFIEYLNVHITNFNTEEYYSLYKTAIESDFDANTYFLSGDYVSAYKKVIESQKSLRILYYKILTERYEKDTADMLKMSTPIILLTKDKKAEYSLRKGYDYLAKAIQIRKYGFGINKSMLSQKIKFYMNAINNSLKAKRYATFALIESTIPLIDKADYKTQTFDEAMKNIEKVDIKIYDYIRNELVNNLYKKSLPPTFPFLLHHDDNYNMIFEGKKPVLNEIGESINAKVKNFKMNTQESNQNQPPAPSTPAPETSGAETSGEAKP